MIVIPMLGKSSRFFSAGYKEPKYKLPLNGGSVFSHSVSSFKRYFNCKPFLFLVRSDFNAAKFVSENAIELGIRDFRIIEFSENTEGQADTVLQGTRDYGDDEPLIIFNIDTIRHDFIAPSDQEFADGFLEVFQGHGNNWSFVERDKGGRVIRTAEKSRISIHCSNGMYGFRRLRDYREAFRRSSDSILIENGEVYVAPLYNDLIRRGLDIRCIELPCSAISLCGTPDEYQSLISQSKVNHNN